MHNLTLTQSIAGLRNGQFSSRELSEALLARIAEHNPSLNAFITVTAERALASADHADQQRAAGNAGPLCGVPIAHKDIFCTRDVRTSAGSKMLDNFVPPYSATAVERLEQAGAISLGKANMDEFAMGSSNETSYYGAVQNPWARDSVAGGSSGGSAAAVAARLVAGATATDTGGSIRQPAALCGITGLKPTYGRISRWGMIAYASSLDQAGPMARSAEDCALLLREMAGHDQLDSTSAEIAVPDYCGELNQRKDLSDLKIGVPSQYFGAGLDDGVATAVREALAVYESLGATLVEIELPNSALAIPAYYVIAPAEASANLSRFDGVRYGYRCADPKDLEDLYRRSRSEGFGDEVKRRIMIGSYALSAGYYDAYYRKAQQVRQLIKQDYDAAFNQCDLIAGPTTPNTAWAIGEKSSDPVSMYLEDIYTIATNLAGLPGLSLPCGFAQGKPVGLQLTGRHFDESTLLQAAHHYQLNSDWHQRGPEEFCQ
ncbi:Asp-tRNA(Asn)/Glu-tRNA(Gln) amidotransferase subunit GatA [Porticoccaceae bacterium]|nr:Asp-tRNA(Asn)/Glu-tRNA(Gln) amidotransferase subunit GatA [Porticoccaceae bacterium]